MIGKRKLIIISISLFILFSVVTLYIFRNDLLGDFETPYASRQINPSFRITLPENGSSFPRNIAPPEFEWEADQNTSWMVWVDLPNNATLSFETNRNHWVPDADTWENIKTASEHKYCKFSVVGHDGEAFSRSEQFRFRISPHAIDRYVIYRVANYPCDFKNAKPSLYYRDITDLKSRVFFKGGKYCFSCHVPSNKGEAMVLSTRRYKGTGKNRKKVYGVDLLLPGADREHILVDGKEGTKSVRGSMMSSWSPDDDQLLMTVWDGITKIDQPDIKTLNISYDMKGDIAVYNVGDKGYSLLPGACDESVREFWPFFSPDGKTVSFSRTSENGESDIYIVPFNGGKGGEAKPLQGAGENGVSEYFQRYSPDGKWIIFNRVDGPGDNFAELSDLFILPAEGGVPRKLECCREGVLDSVVSWSSRSRWISFTSRRYKNESRIYFAEIDENGKAYPPAKMPNQEVEEVGKHPAYHHACFIRDKKNVEALMSIFKKID